MSNFKPEYFRDRHNLLARGAQAFPVLAHFAFDRRLPFYEDVAAVMLVEDESDILVNKLGKSFDRLAAWLLERGLPNLCDIVISKKTGIPGCAEREFVNAPFQTKAGEWPRVIFEVHNTNWFAIVPPTIDDIAAAWERFMNAKKAAA